MGTPVGHNDPTGVEHSTDDHLQVVEKQRSGSSGFTARNTVSMESHREQVERSRRLDDEITVLQAERMATRISTEQGQDSDFSLRRSRSRRANIPQDEFDIATKLPTEKGSAYRPPEAQSTRLARAIRNVHSSFWLLRYFIYITPIGGLLVIPVALGTWTFPNALVGGVYLMWFAIWLEIVWLALWAGRILAHMIPWPIGVVTSLFSDDSKKWRDMAKQLEIPMTLFLWGLALEVSFLPLMHAHMVPNYQGDTTWMETVNEIIISILVGVILNLFEKIIIQLTAISFHTRTYQDRIQTNNATIGFLVHLYTHSKSHLDQDDSDFEDNPFSGPGSGARTPMQYVEKAQKNANHAFHKVGDAAGKIAEDFTGRKSRKSTHPSQVVLVLLNTDKGCKVLARRLFRTFAHKSKDPQSAITEKDPDEEEEVIYAHDLKPAFDSPGAEPEHVTDVANEAFTIFDRDMNGDINQQELELAVAEAGSERKSILASLKDLDSVVSKFDHVLVWLVVLIALLVLLSLVSKSAAGVLTSAGSTLLALSWLFSTSAQEFLGSLIFVFIKHPFDVGDRVSIYGNTGSTLKGDDYFVKEVSLLYTEFKKLEGQVVQAPNNYLNTLFILNMRRSGGLAEALPLSFKFGTTLDQIDGLRDALLEFVLSEPREYQPKILTEVRDIIDCWSVNVQVIFFYKTNWQNELLRLRRRNKFLCMLMHYINEMGIESPQARMPGYTSVNPMHINYSTDAPAVPPRPANLIGHGHDGGNDAKSTTQESSSNAGGPVTATTSARQPSILRHRTSVRARGESVSSLSKRVDFSLGMQDVASENLMGDVHEATPEARTQSIVRNAAAAAAAQQGGQSRSRISTIEEGEEPATAPGERERAPSTSDAGPASDRASTHRNRFLGLKLGRSRGNSVMSAGNSDAAERGAAGVIDPRSGMTSPQAVRSERSGSLLSRPSMRRSSENR